MKRSILYLPVICFCALLMTVPLQGNDEKNFYGDFLLGYRTVDTSGTIEKYKEDINLEKGLRLFSLSLHYVPENSLKKAFDRIDLNVYNFGGDPFETFTLSVQKYGKYKFQYDRKKAEYFYADQHQDNGALYDHHTLNFDRTMDSGYAKFWLGKNADVYLNFNRFSKKGESVTTFDINRIEFEFEKPVDESYREVALGINLHVKRYSLLFEEKFQEYENANSLFLPGYEDGGPFASYPSALYYFNLNQPYNLETSTHTIKVNARPFDNLLISGSAQISNQDMDISYLEEAKGVSYLNRSFEYGYSGSGNFDRKIKLYDFDLTYLLFNKVAIVGAVRSNDFEQNGYLEVAGEKKDAAFNFDTLGFEGGLQFQFSPKLALTLGYRNETRTLDNMETATYELETQRNGFFGNFKFNPLQSLSFTADYQRGDYKDPFTLIGPTDLNRLKMAVKLHLNQFSLSGSYLWQDTESKVFENEWDSTRNQLDLRLGYRAQKVKISGGYALIDVEHKADRSIAYPPSWSGAGTFAWQILYEGKSNLFDAALSFDLSESVKAGGFIHYYKNTGFWEITRTMIKAYIEYTFESGLLAQAAYRLVDFKEKSSGFNDYKANILEVSFGFRWK